MHRSTLALFVLALAAPSAACDETSGSAPADTGQGGGSQPSSGSLDAGGSGRGGERRDAQTDAMPNPGGEADGGLPNGESTGAPATLPGGFQLAWSDEMAGDAIDASKWEHEVDCWGGGNGEDQCYVADAKNAFVEGGLLHLVALKDAPSGPVAGPDDDPNVVTKGHSSARLRTRGMGDFKYGRFEVRAKLPSGRGLWPAIWMLPTDKVYGGWAQSGEIDIMEAVNLDADDNDANRVYGTLHYGGAWPANVHTGESYVPPTDLTELFHVFSVEWEEGEIRWYVDDVLYATQTSWTSNGSPFPAPFDQRFHLILNVAVGGQWPGPPNAETQFPQEMAVDYVRVYQCPKDPSTGRGCGR